MKITFLGTGDFFNKKHGNNSAVLEFDGTNMLLDCGPSVPAALEQKGIQVENIWISHLHGDHVAGLEEIGYKSMFFTKTKPTLHINMGLLDGLRDHLESIMRHGYEGMWTLEDFFNINEYCEMFKVNNSVFKAQYTKHMHNMSAWMLFGNNFVYTADTRFVNWDTEFQHKDFKYIFHDVSFKGLPEQYRVHADISDLETLSEEVRRKIYLMHYPENVEEYDDRICAAQMNYVSPSESIYLV